MNERTNNDKPLIDQHAIELLNRSIDGELSSQEQTELERLIAESESLGSDYLELNAVSSLLDQAPEYDPPEYLQSAIEKQVRLPVTHHGAKTGQGTFGNWLQASWFRTGFALAAGVLLTVGVYQMGSDPMMDQDSENLVGTVVKRPVSEQGELLGTILIEKDVLSGVAELRQANDLFVLDLQLNSAGSSEVAVNFEGRGLVFEDIQSAENSDGAITARNGSVAIASSGEQHFTLKFRRASEQAQLRPLELEFFHNNELIHEAQIGVSGN